MESTGEAGNCDHFPLPKETGREGSGSQGKRSTSNEDQAPPAGCRGNSKPLLW